MTNVTEASASGHSLNRRALPFKSEMTGDADVAVIYYAGHGIELDGNNYLIPTDAILETDSDLYDEAFPLERLLVSMEPAKQLRLMILDACATTRLPGR